MNMRSSASMMLSRAVGCAKPGADAAVSRIGVRLPYCEMIGRFPCLAGEL